MKSSFTEKISENSIIYEIPAQKFNAKSLNPLITEKIDYPKFSFGFQHYYHQSLDKLDSLLAFKNRVPIYNIINHYETMIENHDNDIYTVMERELELKESKNLFFTMWEILATLNIFPSSSKITGLHIGESGSFPRAIEVFRKFMKTDNKNDIYYLYNNRQNSSSKSNKIKYMKIDKDSSKYIGVQFQNADIITTNIKSPGENRLDKIIHEQNIMKDVINQMCIILENQKKGGTAILKIYETYTKSMIKLIMYMRSHYKKCYIMNPLISRKYLMTKYLILSDFNGDYDKNIVKDLKNLSKNLNNKKYVNDIFPDYDLDNMNIIKATFIKNNTDNSNIQYYNINSISDFISKQNYRGDTYNKHRNIQIQTTEIWLDNFYRNINYDKTNNIIENNKKKVDSFMEKLQ